MKTAGHCVRLGGALGLAFLISKVVTGRGDAWPHLAWSAFLPTRGLGAGAARSWLCSQLLAQGFNIYQLKTSEGGFEAGLCGSWQSSNPQAGSPIKGTDSRGTSTAQYAATAGPVKPVQVNASTHRAGWSGCLSSPLVTERQSLRPPQPTVSQVRAGPGWAVTRPRALAPSPLPSGWPHLLFQVTPTSPSGSEHPSPHTLTGPSPDARF